MQHLNSRQKTISHWCTTWCAMLLLAALQSPANAQPRSNWHGQMPDLSASDIEAIKTVTSRMLLAEPEIEEGRWHNPRSGNSGTVWLHASFERDGRICRELRHELIYDAGVSPDQFAVTRCLHGDGRWMIEDN